MRASGDDDESFCRAERKSRVINQVIGFNAPIRIVNYPFAGISLLEGKLPWDLPEKDKVICNPDRFCGEVQPGTAGGYPPHSPPSRFSCHLFL